MLSGKMSCVESLVTELIGIRVTAMSLRYKPDMSAALRDEDLFSLTYRPSWE